MRCLTDEQIESLVARPGEAAHAGLRRHAESCATCGQRLRQARADAALVGDIRELRERRERVKPLVEGLPLEPQRGNR